MRKETAESPVTSSRENFDKTLLMKGVERLEELDASPIIVCPQPKLYTIFSICFQYFLYRASKNPGYYIVRVEDADLAGKIARKAKDRSSRAFIQKLLTSRKHRFQDSFFFLDFFNLQSWNMTKDLAPEKIQGSLIIKNTTVTPFKNQIIDEDVSVAQTDHFKDLHWQTLAHVSPKTVILDGSLQIDQAEMVKFPFITEEEDSLEGVRLNPSVQAHL